MANPGDITSQEPGADPYRTVTFIDRNGQEVQGSARYYQSYFGRPAAAGASVGYTYDPNTGQTTTTVASSPSSAPGAPSAGSAPASAPAGGTTAPTSTTGATTGLKATGNQNAVQQAISAWGGNPNDPQFQQIINDAVANDYLSLPGGSDLVKAALRNTSWFQTRFAPAIARSKAGLAPISPETQLGLEGQYRNILQAGGLPSGFYDQPEDFASWITGDVSPSEITNRVQQGYRTVAAAPQQVRDKFAQFYGPQGDSALAAFFLDPARAEPILENMAKAAEFAGHGAMQGIDIGSNTAEGLAGLGLSQYRVDSGFQHLNQERGIFESTYSEPNDLAIGREGVGSEFGLNPGAQDLINRRVGNREAAVRGGGNAIASGQGVSGLGTADTGPARR